MKIIGLQVENLKKIVAVEIRPDHNLVQITGRNGQGKTSVLDAIWWALAGAKNFQTKPIRAGAEQAIIKVDLGELKVTRKFNAQEGGDFTTSLIVENGDGARFGKPQDVLNAVLGALTFDPLAFMRMAPNEQFDLLRSFVKGVDFPALTRADREDFEERTTQNRLAKQYRAQAEGIVLPAGPVPARVDVTEIEKKLANVASHNDDVTQRKGARDRAAARVAEISEQIDKLLLERAEMEEKLASAPPLPELQDVAEVQLELSQARETNGIADRAAMKDNFLAQARAAEEKSAVLTKALEQREELRAKAIAGAALPVEGIAFSGETVTLDGLPFEQASMAKQLRVAVALASALNPKLRIAFIRDGSLLDDDAMAWLAQFAQDNDLQVWIERVDGSGLVGFVLEQGEMATGAQAPRRKPAPEPQHEGEAV